MASSSACPREIATPPLVVLVSIAEAGATTGTPADEVSGGARTISATAGSGEIVSFKNSDIEALLIS
jgi:hypothetical protein